MASWSPPDPTNGIITAYTVFCKMPSDQEFTTLNISTLSATIMELIPFTSYECYVTANTSVGEGPPSNNDTAMTDEGGEFSLKVVSREIFCFVILLSTLVYPIRLYTIMTTLLYYVCSYLCLSSWCSWEPQPSHCKLHPPQYILGRAFGNKWSHHWIQPDLLFCVLAKQQHAGRCSLRFNRHTVPVECYSLHQLHH